MLDSLNRDLFEDRINYPDVDSRDRLARLVGLDDYKSRLIKLLGILTNPQGLSSWIESYHPGATDIVDAILRRPPLIIHGGDVGTGKTELAETIGDAVARDQGIPLSLFPLRLSTRGQGRVGEMTSLLSAAFDHTVSEAAKVKAREGKSRGGIILLVDEADALAQSREATQMHHEDRAGVNALVRGIDRIATARLPAAVIMCTNRLSALDPAVRRRAAEILIFERPNSEHRSAVLHAPLSLLGFSTAHIERLVAATGPTKTRDFGFTYSDLTQRLLPKIILDAYPHRSVDPSRALKITKRTEPTDPFHELT